MPRLSIVREPEQNVQFSERRQSLRAGPGSTATASRCQRAIRAALGVALGLAGAPLTSAAAAGELPAQLSQTGLYADPATHRVAEGLIAFTPQYQLWSDGASKRRWLSLPPGGFVDASDPDAWVFPVGTRFWKEFSFGRRVETRYIDRTEEGWRFATYRWLPDESDGDPRRPSTASGAVHETAPGVFYDLPSRYDCRACHEGNVSRVLGFTALQLSRDRDPTAIQRALSSRTRSNCGSSSRAGSCADFPKRSSRHRRGSLRAAATSAPRSATS